MVSENEMPFRKQHCLRLNQPLVCGEKGVGCDAATKDNSEKLRVGELARGAVKELM